MASHMCVCVHRVVFTAHFLLFEQLSIVSRSCWWSINWFVFSALCITLVITIVVWARFLNRLVYCISASQHSLKTTSSVNGCTDLFGNMFACVPLTATQLCPGPGLCLDVVCAIPCLPILIIMIRAVFLLDLTSRTFHALLGNTRVRYQRRAWRQLFKHLCRYNMLVLRLRVSCVVLNITD